MKFIEFIFSNIWVFLGFLVLLSTVGDIILKFQKNLLKRRKNVSKTISEIKEMTEFIEESVSRLTTGNLSHKQSGIRNAVNQINSILDELK